MGLPPTSSKISTDANEITTFKFDFPNFTGTHTGTLLSLAVNSTAGGGTGLSSPGTSGNVLTSNGTIWTSSTPPVYALQDLSNLTSPTSINQDLIPQFPGINVGSVSLPFVFTSLDYIIANQALTGQIADIGNDSLDNVNFNATNTLALRVGHLKIVDGSQGTAGYIWTSTDTLGSGHWAPSPAASAITALTGDGTATGPGSVPFTLATVNSNVGSFGSSSAVPSFTVNAKGLITAASSSQLSLTSGVSGVLPIANGGTDNGALPVTAGGVLYTDGSIVQNTGAGTSGQVLTSNGASAPTFQPANGSLSYSSAYFSTSSSWSTSSSSFVDGTNSGGNTLTVRVASGITLTAAASNVCGITFTPPNSSAAYLITANIGVINTAATGAINVRLTDGTTVISSPPDIEEAAGSGSFSLVITATGIYAPGTTSPVTVKIQLAAIGGGTAEITAGGAGPASVEWTVLRVV